MANAKLRKVDVLVSQGQSASEAVRSIGVTQFTHQERQAESVRSGEVTAIALLVDI